MKSLIIAVLAAVLAAPAAAAPLGETLGSPPIVTEYQQERDRFERELIDMKLCRDWGDLVTGDAVTRSRLVTICYHKLGVIRWEDRGRVVSQD